MPLLQTLLDPGRELLLANLDSMCAGLKECSRAAGLLQAKAKVIHSLYHASNARLGNDKTAASYFRGKKIPQAAQPMLDRRVEPSFELTHSIRNLTFRLDDNLRCGARRRGPQIRNKVANRQVHLVTHCRNDRL